MTKTDGAVSAGELLGNLPLQYVDGPDYCTVTDATGGAFALTVQPELMKLMEQAARRSPVPATVNQLWETIRDILVEDMRFSDPADYTPGRPVEQTAKKIAAAVTSARCSSSIEMGRLNGAIACRSRSIPARMEFLTLSKNSQIGKKPMAHLKTLLTQNDHVRGRRWLQSRLWNTATMNARIVR